MQIQTKGKPDITKNPHSHASESESRWTFGATWAEKSCDILSGRDIRKPLNPPRGPDERDLCFVPTSRVECVRYRDSKPGAETPLEPTDGHEDGARKN